MTGDPAALTPVAADVLQKTLQEALVNIAKHARAQGACVRIETTGGHQGASAVVIDRLLNKPGSGLSPVFAYTTNGSGRTTYASAHVEVPARGARTSGYGHRIVLDDGFYMRNLNG